VAGSVDTTTWSMSIARRRDLKQSGDTHVKMSKTASSDAIRVEMLRNRTIITVRGWRATTDGRFLVDSCQPEAVQPDWSAFTEADNDAANRRKGHGGSAKGRLFVLRRQNPLKASHESAAFMLAHCEPRKPFLITMVGLATTVEILEQAQIYRQYFVNCAIQISAKLPWQPQRLDWRVRDDREARVVAQLGSFRRAPARDLLRHGRFSGTLLSLQL
jgi:hypothetical protein